MKQAVSTFALVLAILTFSTPAGAHCGSCGVGGEQDTQEECDTKCADQAEDTACVQECLEKHEKQHEEKKAQ